MVEEERPHETRNHGPPASRRRPTLPPARPAILSLLLAACATSGGAPDRIVRGCWIDRAGETTTTMRWLPDRGDPTTLIGETVIYGPGGATGGTRYSLERRGEGWVFCHLDTPIAAPIPCWPVSGAPMGRLEHGRVAIQGSGEHLHITRIADDEVEDVYVGRRDGCD